MDFIKRSLNFHSTFQPQEIYLTKILDLANKNYIGNKEEISELTGIPTGKNTGKVIPHIKYLQHMGLISAPNSKNGYELALTKIGHAIYENDKYFDEKLTKLICHYYITEYKTGAPQWIYLFKETPNMLETKISNKTIKDKANMAFNKPVDFSIVKNSYNSSKNTFFSSLNLLKFDNEFFEFKENYSNYEFMHFYAFALLDLWEKYSNTEDEIIIDKVINDFKWTKIFGFTEKEMMNIFDELQELGILKVNKQMKPLSIQRLKEKEDLIDDIYINLI